VGHCLHECLSDMLDFVVTELRFRETLAVGVTNADACGASQHLCGPIELRQSAAASHRKLICLGAIVSLMKTLC
jgi:hypothetical protein